MFLRKLRNKVDDFDKLVESYNPQQSSSLREVARCVDGDHSEECEKSNEQLCILDRIRQAPTGEWMQQTSTG